MHRNSRGEVLIYICNYVGVCNCNEAEVLAILEAFLCFLRNFRCNLIVESDSSHAVAWAFNRKAYLWKFKFLFKEILALSSIINMLFHHDLRSAQLYSCWCIGQTRGVRGLVQCSCTFLFLCFSLWFSFSFWTICNLFFLLMIKCPILPIKKKKRRRGRCIW